MESPGSTPGRMPASGDSFCSTHSRLCLSHWRRGMIFLAASLWESIFFDSLSRGGYWSPGQPPNPMREVQYVERFRYRRGCDRVGDLRTWSLRSLVCQVRTVPNGSSPRRCHQTVTGKRVESLISARNLFMDCEQKSTHSSEPSASRVHH